MEQCLLVNSVVVSKSSSHILQFLIYLHYYYGRTDEVELARLVANIMARVASDDQEWYIERDSSECEGVNVTERWRLWEMQE